jgi:4-amino-4-deoxy-L-arabinose transferase-like glycosyltransferase
VTPAAPPTPAAPDALPARALVILAALAAVPRLAAVAALRHAAIFSDMMSYHAKAVRVANGLWYGIRDRVPLYPHAIGWVYRIVGVHATAIYVLQASVESAAIAAFAYAVSRRLGRRVGLAAGLFGALYPSRFFYSGLLLSENPAIILMCLFVCSLLFLEERPTLARALVAGSLAGLGFLARPVLCLSVAGALFAVWRMRLTRRRRAGLSALALAGFLTAAAPWIVITRLDTGYWILGDLAGGGGNFWMGNNPEASGRYYLPPATALWDTSDYYRLDVQLRREAVHYALSHPFRTAFRWIPKTSYWWSPEHRDLMYLYSNAWIPPVPRGALWASYLFVGAGFVFLVPYALRGALLRSTPALTGCLAAATSVWGLCLLSWADSRFHMPVLPFLWLFAGLGLASRQRLSGRRRAACVVLTLLFLGNAAYDLATSASTVRRLAAPDGTTLRYGYEIWR